MDPNAESQTCEIEDIGGVAVVRVGYRMLDRLPAITNLARELSRLVESEKVRNILLDLSGVEMVSSVMLGKLISLQGRLSSAGGKLVLCNLHPQVREVCAITKLTRLFEIQDDEADGLAAF